MFSGARTFDQTLRWERLAINADEPGVWFNTGIFHDTQWRNKKF